MPRPLNHLTAGSAYGGRLVCRRRYLQQVSERPGDEADWALWSEQLLFDTSRQLDPDEAPGRGKSLLVRPTAEPVAALRTVALHAVGSDDDWHQYERERIAVEAGFGFNAATAQAMVDALRARADQLGLRLFLARDEERLVGAPVPAAGPALRPATGGRRVLPTWRGRGYGDTVLAAIVDLLASEGSTMVVVGADEDDWPLSWYRRRGFRDVGRVPPTH